MGDVLGGARSVLRTALAIAAVLLVFWILGVITTPGGGSLPFMAAVGTGIKWTFTQLGTLIKAL